MNEFNPAESRQGVDPKEFLAEQYQAFWRSIELVGPRNFENLTKERAGLVEFDFSSMDEDDIHFEETRMAEFVDKPRPVSSRDLLPLAHCSHNPYEHGAIIFNAVIQMLRGNKQEFYTPVGEMYFDRWDRYNKGLDELDPYQLIVGNESEIQLAARGQVEVAGIICRNNEEQKYYRSLLRELGELPFMDFLTRTVGDPDMGYACMYSKKSYEAFLDGAETGEERVGEIEEGLLPGVAQWVHKLDRAKEIVEGAFMLSIILALRGKINYRKITEQDPEARNVEPTDVDSVMSELFDDETIQHFKELHDKGIRPLDQEQLVGLVLAELQGLE